MLLAQLPAILVFFSDQFKKEFRWTPDVPCFIVKSNFVAFLTLLAWCKEYTWDGKGSIFEYDQDQFFSSGKNSGSKISAYVFSAYVLSS